MDAVRESEIQKFACSDMQSTQNHLKSNYMEMGHC